MLAHRAEWIPSLSRKAFQIHRAPTTLATATHTNRHARAKSVKRMPQATPVIIKTPPVVRKMFAAALMLDGKSGRGFRACLTSQGTMKKCITTAKQKAYGSTYMFIA